jgi:hypothetical protein
MHSEIENEIADSGAPRWSLRRAPFGDVIHGANQFDGFTTLTCEIQRCLGGLRLAVR